MNRIFTSAFAAALLSFPVLAYAQTQPDFSKIDVKAFDLGHRTWMLEGAGGNVTVATGDDGVIMVDGQFAPMHDKLKAAIAAVSGQPIKFLVNTHHHGDHTGGNAGFAREGTVIVAHVNVRNFLAAGTTSNTTGVKVPPVSGAGLPSKTYDDDTGPVLEVKGRKAILKHPAHAHTGGDTYVYFPEANVLSTGDTFTNGRYPNIDWVNGGNISGMIAATDAYLALANDQTKIVPGHGPLANKTQLAAFNAMLKTARDRMAKLIAEGKSEDEIYASKPFADFDAKMKASELQSKNFMKVVYHSLKQ
ncbi:MAG TPA: MBL fold metallo-hydrolase [Pseudolabrys sp.]|nr:MBL fold metallo-hydrolase [Pseudolabrys sp.]